MSNKIMLSAIILISSLFIVSVFFCLNYRSNLQRANGEILSLQKDARQAAEEIASLQETNQQYYAELEEIRGIYPPKDFNSIEDLSTWLHKDKTSERQYSPNYDCDDFAFDLWSAALEDGYRIGIVAFSSTNPILDLLIEDYHTMNFALIGNNVYYIEPQNDWFTFSGGTRD